MKYIILSLYVLLVFTSLSQNTEESDEKEDSIVVFYQCPAEFIGGHPAMLKYLSSNLDQTMLDGELYELAELYITFVVEKDGSVTEQDITNREGESVLSKDTVPFPNMPKWKPACDENSDPVRQLVRTPLNVNWE
jgi:hypothetical protein